MVDLGNKESPASALPRSLWGWLRMWFMLSEPVDRRAYAVSGFGLMLFKYAVEAAVIGVLTGLFYTPLDFMNPLISAREHFVRGMPEWLGLAWVLWTFPFLWIAVVMSVRRALDGGVSPWHGLWVLVPIVNLFVMLWLACLRSAAPASSGMKESEERAESWKDPEVASSLRAGLGGIVCAALYALVGILFSVYVLGDYGANLLTSTSSPTPCSN